MSRAALEELASRDRELLQELLTAFAAAYARGEGSRVGARLRGPAAPRARAAARARGDPRASSSCASARSWSTSSRTRTASRPSCVDLLWAGPAKELFFVGDEFQSIYGFRHADVAVFRDRRAAAPQVLPLTLQLPLAARGARRGQRAVRGRVRRELPAARARRGGYGDPLFGTPFELLVTDKAAVRRLRGALAPRRGAARRAPRPRARRRGCRDPGRDRPPLRGRHRRRVVRGGAARASTCRRTG